MSLVFFLGVTLQTSSDGSETATSELQGDRRTKIIVIVRSDTSDIRTTDGKDHGMSINQRPFRFRCELVSAVIMLGLAVAGLPPKAEAQTTVSVRLIQTFKNSEF